MVDYLGPIIVFVGVIIALTGDTLNPNKLGLLKVTPTGWATSAISVLGLIVAILSVNNANSEKKSLNENLAGLHTKLETSQDQLSTANLNLEKSNSMLLNSNGLLEKANNQINVLQESTNQISQRQSRQEVEITNKYLRFSEGSRETITAVSGSIIHIYGFSCRVTVQAPEIRKNLQRGENYQIPLIGRAGRQIRATFSITHRNSNPLSQGSECSGKIRVVGINQ